MTLRSFGDVCLYVVMMAAVFAAGYGLADADILKTGIASFILIICSTILTRSTDRD